MLTPTPLSLSLSLSFFSSFLSHYSSCYSFHETSLLCLFSILETPRAFAFLFCLSFVGSVIFSFLPRESITELLAGLIREGERFSLASRGCCNAGATPTTRHCLRRYTDGDEREREREREFRILRLGCAITEMHPPRRLRQTLLWRYQFRLMVPNEFRRLRDTRSSCMMLATPRYIRLMIQPVSTMEVPVPIWTFFPFFSK